MNAVRCAAIGYAVRLVDIEIPAFAFVHDHAHLVQHKLHFGIRDDGNVQAHLAVFKTKFVDRNVP